MAKGPTAEQAAKIAKATYDEFLEEPERSKQIGNIPKLIDKFEGDYGTMLKALQSKYGKASPKKASAPAKSEEPAPKKKAVKKKAIKKKVAKKKVVRKAAPAKKETSEPSVNMGKGISDITCPSCEKVHHIEENTSRFCVYEKSTKSKAK